MIDALLHGPAVPVGRDVARLHVAGRSACDGTAPKATGEGAHHVEDAVDVERDGRSPLLAPRVACPATLLLRGLTTRQRTGGVRRLVRTSCTRQGLAGRPIDPGVSLRLGVAAALLVVPGSTTGLRLASLPLRVVHLRGSVRAVRSMVPRLAEEGSDAAANEALALEVL